MSETIKLPLGKLYNRKLVYANPPYSDNYGIEGAYIAESDFKLGESGKADGIDFAFGKGEFDVVECDSQILNVDACADKLHIIGFALWCDAYAVLSIVYRDGTSECVTVPFIDWAHEFSFSWFDMSSVGGDVKSHGAIASGEQTRPVFLHHIVGNEQEIPTLAEVRELVRNRIYDAVVLLFEFVQFLLYFGFLFYPIPAEHFIEAYFVGLLEAVYIRLVDVESFHKLDCFVFLDLSIHSSYSPLMSLNILSSCCSVSIL